MALQPNLKTTVFAGRLDAPHSLDIFLDYVCPYSAKMAFTLDRVVKPLLDAGGKYDGKVKAIFRLQVQPWHSTSTLTHEAALAVARIAPDKFWAYSLVLFKAQSDYFDQAIENLTVKQIREKLVALALPIVGVDKKDVLVDLLSFKTSANGGVAVTDDLKYNIKFTRQNGVHVSPTVLWDGLVASEVSSASTEQDWNDFFKARVIV